MGKESPADSSPPTRVRAYVGTYTQGDPRGIHFGDLELSSGRLDIHGSVVCPEDPSFLVIDAARQRLYAAHEINEFAGQESGAVSAFRLDPDTGQPALLNTRPSGGAGPCHLSVDPEGHFVLAANYEGGSVALLSLEQNGQLGEDCDVVAHHGSSVDPERQDRPHAHSVVLAPAGRRALATDLGTDQIFLYEPDADGRRFLSRRPETVSVQAGAGPRHMAFHPDGHVFYVINELASTVTVWEYDAASLPREVQSLSTLPEGFQGTSSGMEVQVHPSGRFLYASNSGHDSLAIYQVEAGTGCLTSLGHTASGGKGPRHFSIDPTGAYLLVAHEHSGTVVTFAMDADTGALTPAGHPVEIPNAVCVQMVALPPQGESTET